MYFMPESISTYGADIDYIWRLVTWFALIWFVVALGAIIFFAIYFRRRNGQKAQYIRGIGWKQTRWILVPLALVFLSDLFIDIETARVWGLVEYQPQKTDLTVRITGKQWYWAFTYPGPDGKIGTPDDLVVNENTSSELHLPMNKVINLELTSVDVLHSFWVKETRLKQDVIPGRVINRWLNVNKPGRYELACAEICGMSHAKMRNWIKVESQEDYDKYIAELTKKVEANKKKSGSPT
ncbi:MAG: hypothetical protein LDLANPLL_01682 [Turneriella sp.]|nr:hypothetical protein [Turneriella sp.]